MSKNQSYSAEFRAEAVKLVLEQGLSQPAAARRLSIPKGTLGNWIAAAKTAPAGAGGAAPGSRSVGELEHEIARLRGELAEARMKRDVLKKATVYFAKESLQSTRS